MVKPELKQRKVRNEFILPYSMYIFIKNNAERNMMSISSYLSRISMIKKYRNDTIRNTGVYDYIYNYLMKQEDSIMMNNYISIPEHSDLYKDCAGMTLNSFMKNLCINLFCTNTNVNFIGSTTVGKQYKIKSFFKEDKNMSSVTVTFKVSSFVEVGDPLNNDTHSYHMFVDVVDVPNNIPMNTNPRNQNMKTATVRGIYQSLDDITNPIFHLVNRGITISAKTVKYDNKKKLVTVVFEDNKIHGNIDGGHTYRAILEKQKNFKPNQQFVGMEIISGDVIENNFVKLASARNSSQQIVNKSIANLDNRFDFIKEAIKDEPYSERVFYRENDPGNIDIADITAIINMFNIDKYKKFTDVASSGYTQRKVVMSNYIKQHEKYGDTEENSFYKLRYILKDIISLYDKLESNFDKYYVEGSGMRYGKLPCIKCKENKTKFYNNKVKYITPKGFIFIVLSVFRLLVIDNEKGYFEWKENPFDVMDGIAPELCATIMDYARKQSWEIHKVLKDNKNWMCLYSIAKDNI